METLPIYVRDYAEGNLLPWSRQFEAAARFGVSIAQVEEVALERGILPSRYQRNRKTISVASQLILFRSSVAVIGCGGLGGYIIEELARLGVGRLTVVDPDLFEEHNLNRQLFSTIANQGSPKVQAAVQRIGEINPAVTVTPYRCSFTDESGEMLLNGCSVAVDALDSIPARLVLAKACRHHGIPLVHGSIAGWYGHVTTLLPGDTLMPDMLRSDSSAKGIEQLQGNPSFTPALVASLETAEVCKLLLGTGTSLNRRALMIDLHDMEIHELSQQLQESESP